MKSLRPVADVMAIVTLSRNATEVVSNGRQQ